MGNTKRLSLAALGLVAACGFPETRMVPAADYKAANKASYSSAPAHTAGSAEMLTYSPDGSTLFVCTDGSTVRGNAAVPGSKPVC